MYWEYWKIMGGLLVLKEEEFGEFEFCGIFFLCCMLFMDDIYYLFGYKKFFCEFLVNCKVSFDFCFCFVCFVKNLEIMLRRSCLYL